MFSAKELHGSLFRLAREFRLRKRIFLRKAAASPEEAPLKDLDRWVRKGRFTSRSRAVQSAVAPLTEREKRNRLARETGEARQGGGSTSRSPILGKEIYRADIIRPAVTSGRVALGERTG